MSFKAVSVKIEAVGFLIFLSSSQHPTDLRSKHHALSTHFFIQ